MLESGAEGHNLEAVKHVFFGVCSCHLEPLRLFADVGKIGHHFVHDRLYVIFLDITSSDFVIGESFVLICHVGWER